MALHVSEEDLIERARQSLSQSNWVVGECAEEWTQRYSKGRTDEAFGQMVGLSREQVYQRRAVWTTFRNTYSKYPDLAWSFFYVALLWEDAVECLEWAQENEASVAEMRAWRRAQHDEDLFVPASDEPPSDWGSAVGGAPSGFHWDGDSESGELPEDNQPFAPSLAVHSCDDSEGVAVMERPKRETSHRDFADVVDKALARLARSAEDDFERRTLLGKLKNLVEHLESEV